MQVGAPKMVLAVPTFYVAREIKVRLSFDSELCLLVTDLKLNQKGILCKGIGIGDRSARTISLVVTEFVIDTDFTLNLRWKILEVVIESHDGARVQIVAHLRIGIELFIHDNRFPVLEGSIRNKILPEEIPCPPLHTRGSVSAALDHVRAGSLRWGADCGLVGSVMPLPPLALHHQAGKVSRRIAEIKSIPVEGSFPAPIDSRIGIVALSCQYRKTEK